MAVIHRATLVPSKLELLGTWLKSRLAEPSDGAVELLGAYRFDDPDGEVGIEGHLIRWGTEIVHVPVTYRGSPLAGAEHWLIGTMEHSVLGRRWVYDAMADPVARRALLGALGGTVEQAAWEVWDGDRLVETRQPTVRVRREGSTGRAPVEAGQVTVEEADSVVRVVLGTAELRVARVLGRRLPGEARLIGDWAGGSADLASVG